MPPNYFFMTVVLPPNHITKNFSLKAVKNSGHNLLKNR